MRPLALALIVVLQSAPARANGPVALVGRSYLLDAPTCASLAGPGGPGRLLLVAGDPARASDPLAACGTAAERIDLDPLAPGVGNDAVQAAKARAATSVCLSGGTWLEWFHILTPEGKRSRLAEAIREANVAGTPVIAEGSAAPFLARWALVSRAALQRPLRNPREEKLDLLVEGLGLLPEFAVDTRARGDASAAPLLRGVFDARFDRALFLDGEVAWIADARGRAGRVEGTGACLLFDFSTSRRLRDAWSEARFAVLSAGDAWSERDGVVFAAPRAAPRADAAAEQTLAADDGLASSALIRAFGILRSGAALSVTLAEGPARVRMRLDGRPAALLDLEWRSPLR